jgi:ATP-dependent helicase/nuclease subunit A
LPRRGLRIETIHAFSQWLLSAFPVESGLLPGTRAMEDRDRELLVREVLAQMLVEAEESGDERVLDALAHLALRMDQGAVIGFLLRCAKAIDLWQEPGAWRPPLRPRINQLLGLDADEDGSGVAALCADDAFDVASVRRCMAANAAWGTKTGIDAANMMGDWLAANPQARLAGIDDFAKLFLTAKGEAKSARNLDKHEPAYADYQARVIAGITALRDRIALVNLAALLDPALTWGGALPWPGKRPRRARASSISTTRSALPPRF